MISENCIPLEELFETGSEKRIHRTFFDIYSRLWMAGVLIFTDMFCLCIAIAIALQTLTHTVFNLSLAYDKLFALLAIVVALKFYRSGLYSAIGLHYIDELERLVNGLGSSFVIVLAVTFLFQTSLFYSRLLILSTWLLGIVFIPLGRYLVRRLLIYWGLWGLPVVIIGCQDRAKTLAAELRINLHHGIRPDIILCDERYAEHARANCTVFTLEQISAYCKRLSIQDALIMIDDMNDLDNIVDHYRFTFNRVILIKDQVGQYGLNNLVPLDFVTTLGLQVKNHLLSWQAQIWKKLIDVLGAFFGLLLLAPWLGLAALLISLDSPGRVFYRQPRLGRRGEHFELIKFRTMHIHADEILKMELARDPLLKQEWDSYQKLKDDPRVTRVGKFLRKFSLDELPQLWNILRGEMSLVGPRPIMLGQREMYGVGYKDYIHVTPGITGLWQVSGRNRTSFARRAELDGEYIQRWSMWMDIFILVKTIKVVLWRDGAY